MGEHVRQRRWRKERSNLVVTAEYSRVCVELFLSENYSIEEAFLGAFCFVAAAWEEVVQHLVAWGF